MRPTWGLLFSLFILTKMPILYSFRRCPYAMRARMALLYSDIGYDHREVDLKSKPESLYKYSSKATVPVFVTDQGKVIDESLDIIDYSLNKNDPEGLLDLSKEEAELADNLSDLYSNNFMQLLRRYKYFERYPEKTQQDYLQLIEDSFLIDLENRLYNSSGPIPYILSKKSKADIAIIPLIRQFAYVNKEYFYNSPYKNIITWLDSFIKSQEFDKKIMHKYSTWQDPML